MGHPCRTLDRLGGWRRTDQRTTFVGLSILSFLVEMSGEFTPLTAYEDNAKNEDEEDSDR
jgi:hypothetical protein